MILQKRSFRSPVERGEIFTRSSPASENRSISDLYCQETNPERCFFGKKWGGEEDFFVRKRLRMEVLIPRQGFSAKIEKVDRKGRLEEGKPGALSEKKRLVGFRGKGRGTPELRVRGRSRRGKG